MDLEKELYQEEKEPVLAENSEKGGEKSAAVKSGVSDSHDYFTNINGIYAKDVDGRAETAELRTLVTRTYSETVLWENDSTTNPSTITLSSAYTNFDAIVIVHKHEEASNLYTSTSTYISSAVDINDMLGISLGDGPNLYTWYKLTAANELTLSVSGLLLNKIIGIKY